MQNIDNANVIHILLHVNNKNMVKNSETNKKATKFSFRKGFGQIQYKDAKIVRKEIMEALNVKTSQSFRNRLKGNTVPTVIEKENIEKIFNKYGVTDIWGTN